jgi:opacity protein-like surface antigen
MTHSNRANLFFACLAAALWVGVSDAKAQESSGWDGMYVSGALSSSSFKHTIDSLHTYNSGHFPNSQNSSATKTGLSVQLGKNWALDRVVVGLELEYDPSKSSKTVCRGASEIPRCISAWEGYLNITDSIALQGSAKVRLGYTFDKLMVYAAAGFARLKHSSTMDVVCPFGCGMADGVAYTRITTVAKNETRPVFGIGLEYQVGGGWNIGADYQYLKSGSFSQSQQKLASYGIQNISSTGSTEVSRLQMRLIYRF